MATRLLKTFLPLVANFALLLPLSLAQTTSDSAVTENATTLITGTTGTIPGSLTTAGAGVTDSVTDSGTQAPQTTAAGNLVTAAPPGIGEGETAIAANTDIGTCVCDLTANACDVNCCCDPDCSTEDLSSFTVCMDTASVVDEQVCLQSTVVFTENVPETVNTSNPSLFCILIDNNAARNYYTVPQVVDTVERFVELADTYGSTTYAPPDDTNQTYADFYKSGDSIYTVYESPALGTLGLPTAGYSSFCDDNSPAAYLLDQETTCVRQLTNLLTDCETVPFLKASTFSQGFKVVPTPSYLTNELPALNGTEEYVSFYANESLVEVRRLEPVKCQDDSGQQNDCNFDSPTYDATTSQCNNILLEVAYTITHNSSGAIERVDVQLVLGNILATTSSLWFAQKFSAAFVKADEAATFERSGNPGYVAGMPILAGTLASQVVDGESRFSIELDSNSNNWLTVIRSTADGSCAANPDSRAPVNFGEDLRSGCMIRVTFGSTGDRCAVIQEAALNALNGNIRDNDMYVATFGNSDVENVGDWVPVFVEQITGTPSSTVEGTCNNMVMALHVEIIYANVGSLANPQAKILGVRYNYAEGRTLQYTCAGAFCQTGADSLIQNYEIVSSVAFIDASTGPAPILAEDPGFEDKLPNDFFYPFTIG